MKTELISARLEKEDTKILEEITKEENTDKTSALKKILKLGSKQYRLEKSIKHYQAFLSKNLNADIPQIFGKFFFHIPLI